MRLLIHDLEEEQFKTLFPKLEDDVSTISDNHTIRNCVGCFGCWIKTPSVCVIKDDYQNIGKLMSQCDEMILLSKCYYGGYSPFVKNVLDRSIGYILPYFTIRNKEMHHKLRYKKQLKITAIVYGEDITEKEKKTMESIMVANAINFKTQDRIVLFCNNQEHAAKIWRSLDENRIN